jgi:hypothetical protein
MAIVTKTVKTSGGDYTSLNAALTAEAKNIVTAGDSYVFECDAFLDANVATVSASWTTDTTHTITIKASTGNQHDFTRGTGYRIVGSFGWWTNCITVSVGNVIINGVAVSQSNSGGGGTGISTAQNITILNCFAYNCTAIGFNHNDNSHANSLIIVNSVAVGCASGIKKEGGYWGAGRLYAYFCDCLNSTSRGFECSSSSISYLKNCYAGGNVTDIYNANSSTTITITTCATVDGSVSTTTLSLASCNFVNSTAGSEDPEITTGSSLIGIGTNLSADAIYPVTTDGYGATRASTPCVGVWEYISSALYSGILKRWNGSAWVKAHMKDKDGNEVVLKRYDGANWVQVDTTGV